MKPRVRKFAPFTASLGGLARSFRGAWVTIEGVTIMARVQSSDDIVHPVGSRAILALPASHNGTVLVFRADPQHRNYGGVCDRCRVHDLAVPGFGRIVLRGVTFAVLGTPTVNAGGVWYGPPPVFVVNCHPAPQHYPAGPALPLAMRQTP